MAFIYSLTDTWNDAGVTFTGIGLNVTDSASNSASSLLNLQVGGVSRFSVRKDGAASTPLLIGNGLLDFSPSTASAATFRITALQQFVTRSTGSFGWASTTAVGSTPDLLLARDAANTLALRNDTNAQAFNIYNTYTDASNYERGKVEWASNVLRIGTEKAGTGTARELQFQTDGVTRLTIAATSNLVTVSSELRLTYLNISQFGGLNAASNGVFRFRDATASGLATVQFGGGTSSFPAIKRDTVRLQARLADDSAFTNIQGKLTTETAYTAGAPTATGYLVLYDSDGTAYKVPAEAL